MLVVSTTLLPCFECLATRDCFVLVDVLVAGLWRMGMQVERALCHGGVASGGSDNYHAVAFMCYHKRGGREVLG